MGDVVPQIERVQEAAERALTWFDDWGLKVIVAVGIAIILTVALQVFVRRFRRKLEGSPSLTQELNLQRIATLTGALSTTGLVVIWVVAVLIVLDAFDVPLAALFASAGVAGVALGFGAQSIVKDVLSGFFILLENQFGVGDAVDVATSGGAVGGKVEAVTLRVTQLRAFDGTLHTVPNGNIQLVSNKSRGWARAIVDVRVAYGEDVDRVRGILEELFEELKTDTTLRDWIQEGPSMLGIERMADTALVLRVVADTRPSKRWDTERVLRERLNAKLDAEGIRVPVGPTVLPGGADAAP
jgi:small-conductance mechanosensitive channel